MANEEQKGSASMDPAMSEDVEGDANASHTRVEGETLSLGNPENPFSLLYQPPSAFLPLPNKQIPQSSSEPSPVFSSLAKYLERLHSQPVSRRELTLCLSDEQPVSNQRTQYHISGFPIVAPLCKLESVLTWEPGQDELCVPTVPLQDRSPDPFNSCSLIVCHDMMGGYLNDRFVQGHGSTEDYFLYHWQHISAFIYFSHHLVCIPPPCWTNAAHRHGIRVLGTVITEWQEGANLCAHILQREETVQLFVQQLIAIAQYYKFDGWLVNIENPIHHSQLDSLYILLTLLTTGMHQAIPGSKVIWYDSVTTTGELKYQNALNEKNESFFTLCDGIFLNYAWTRDALRQSNRLAGSKAPNVFVGIDVFGRGCFGGGGYNTNLALQVIRDHGLSAALFAPGWVYENQDRDSFFEHQDKFWTLLAPYCPTHPISSLPLVSSFSRGFGEHVTVDGEVVFKGRWNNISAQDVQPSFTDYLYKNNPVAPVQIHKVALEHNISYNNGSSMIITGSISGGLTLGNSPANIRLFRTDKLDLSKPLLLCYTYHTQSKYLKHLLRLRTSSSPKFVLLDPEPSSVKTTSSSSVLPFCKQQVMPAAFSLDPIQHKVLSALPAPYADTLNQVFTGHSNSESKSFGWKTSYFILALSGAGTLQGVSVSLYPSGTCPSEEKDFSFHLGEIKVIDAGCVSHAHVPSIIYSLDCIDIHFKKQKSALSLTLSWLTADSKLDPIDHSNIFASVMTGSGHDHQHQVKKKSETDFKFLGRAYCNCFRVVDFAVPFVSGSHDGDGISVAIEFRVQPVTTSRQKLAVNLTHSVLLWLSE